MSEWRAVRVSFERTDDPDSSLRLDALVSPSGQVKPEWEFVGVEFDGSTESHWPFRLGTDGIVDYGDQCEGDDQYWTSDIRKRKLEVGELVSLRSDDADEEDVDEVTYRVVKLTPME